jgi:hypothetical protein
LQEHPVVLVAAAARREQKDVWAVVAVVRFISWADFWAGFFSFFFSFSFYLFVSLALLRRLLVLLIAFDEGSPTHHLEK